MRISAKWCNEVLLQNNCRTARLNFIITFPVLVIGIVLVHSVSVYNGFAFNESMYWEYVLFIEP